jgi:hypothetical protein
MVPYETSVMFVTNSSTTTALASVVVSVTLRSSREISSHLASIQSFEASHPSSVMPSARIVVTVLCTRRPGKHHRVSRQLACRSRDNPSCQSKGLQVGGLMPDVFTSRRPASQLLDIRPAFRASHARRRRCLQQRRSTVQHACIMYW